MSRFGYTSLGFGSGASAAATPFANTKSVDCDGTDFYGAGNHSDLNLNSGFSMSFWFNTDDLSDAPYGRMISWGENAGGKMRALVTVTSKLTYSYYGGGVLHGTTLSTGTWYHACATVDSSSPNQITVYLNGTSTTPATGTYTPTAYTYSGTSIAEGDVGWRYFDGHIDEVGIWNTVLTGSQVNDIYNSGSPGDLTDIESSNLKAWWRMGDGDNGSGTDDNIPSSGSGTVYDMSGNSNDLTLSNCDANTASTDVP